MSKGSKQRLSERTSKYCAKCKETLLIDAFAKHPSRGDGFSPYCRECHNGYRRNNRKKYSELSDEDKFKGNVRAKLKMKVRRGTIIKPTNCAWCGGPDNIEGHHEDYDKPYDVVWVCRGCHKKHHSKITKAITL